jgi:sulfatase maturation enzyme AslB (radical SAM superfamily)
MSDLFSIAQQFRPLEPSGAPPGLPVYILRQAANSILYTPGLVALVANDWTGDLLDFLLTPSTTDLVGDTSHVSTERLGGGCLETLPTPPRTLPFVLGENSRPNHLYELGAMIRARALQNIRAYRSFYEGTFEPKCLTLYLHNQCNLNCSYCLNVKKGYNSAKLSPEIVRKGAEIVARNCWEKQLPFTVVFHGWGEPSYDFQLLRSLVNVIDGVACDSHVKPFRYIATNGVLPVDVAEYLCDHFDFIGISCDGPPDIQNSQRKTITSDSTSDSVEKTAAVLKQKGARFCVRSTITGSTIKRQEEIADYILKRLQPDEIHFEPVYGSQSDLRMEDAETFLDHLDRAVSLAATYHVTLTFSGSRLSEIHGPYCNVFRNVLNLVPGFGATACFLTYSESNLYQITKQEHLPIDHRKVRLLQSALSRCSKQCRHCFNHFHCVGVCPDECVLYSRSKNPIGTFRCRLQLLSAVRQILNLTKEMEIDLRSFSWREIDRR